MSDGFKGFAAAVQRRFKEMSGGELFVVGDKEGMFEAYLAAFPEGTNPLYAERTQHDCSTCKNFVRHLGRVVRVGEGAVETVWDVGGLETPYREVAEAMSAYVRAQPIVSVFRTKERGYGNEATRQLLKSGEVRRWNHLHGTVARRHLTESPGEAVGEFNAAVGVFRRGLDEIRPDALQQIVDLIEANSLYRGQEHLSAVKGFAAAQRRYQASADRGAFVWAEAGSPAARFRNTVIGTLAVDLSEDVGLEAAVRAFETKVAPTNYKRTTALITPRMVADAMKTIEELGLEPALARRLANIGDVSVNNVLWVDRSVRPQMKGGIEGLLLAEATSKPAEGKAIDIGIDAFMTDVLPGALGMEMHVKNAHLPNFVTLTAPVHPDAGRLFRWSNGFAWSYDGNITDSIKEKVKAAGGDVDAKLRWSLAWWNYDDLDLHVVEPDGNHVFYGNKPSRRGGGGLDVDMNAGRGTSRQPVENVALKTPADGAYRVYVNQYSKREAADVGFAVEIASGSGVVQLSYSKPVTGNVEVGKFTVRNGAILEAKYGPGMVGAGISQTKWGVKTETAVKVQTVMYSPNYWDDNRTGNRHVFFILEGCRTEEPARGIYNEFLTPEFEKHRKVFEVLGDKTKCPPIDNQLSGMGFSSTRGDTVTLSVRNERGAHLYNVTF